MEKIKKIVIVGPESTGKSTLAQQLASHFNTSWCPEYARDYLSKNGKDYSYEDLLQIAQGQIALEAQTSRAARNGLFFIDTDMHVLKIWCEVAFGKCHSWILEQLNTRQYDLYLLCKTDLPWVADELREYPDYETRQRLFEMYREALLRQATPWTEISGSDADRFQKAIQAVNGIL